MKVYYHSTDGGIKSGEVEINTLEDLLNFRKTLAINEEIVLSSYRSEEDENFQIEIYNNYRE